MSQTQTPTAPAVKPGDAPVVHPDVKPAVDGKAAHPDAKPAHADASTGGMKKPS